MDDLSRRPDYQPGCAAKYALVIAGDQDVGKSAALSILGGDWFTDDIAQLGTKDSQLQAGNAWIVELAELDSMRGAHVSAITAPSSREKSISSPALRGSRHSTGAASCVLAATVNPAGPYLHTKPAMSGSGRCSPRRFDLEALRHDRDQLWAEAVTATKLANAWWPDDGSTPAKLRKKLPRAAGTTPVDPVQEWIDRKTARHFSASEILAGALKYRKTA